MIITKGDLMFRFYSLLIGYILGCFQTSYFIGRLRNIDIREHGSKNSGATNAKRVLGLKAGVITIICDLLKSMIAYLICYYVFKNKNNLLAGVYGGFGAVLGHDFPFFLNFKGGKGIAASMGLILVFNWKLLIILLSGGLIAIFITHKVSVGSLIGTFLLACSLPLVFVKYNLEVLLVFATISVLAFWCHRENIKRLINHTETNSF